MLEYKCLALGKHSYDNVGRLLAGTERKFGQKVNAEEHPASTNGPSSKVQA